MARSRQSNEAAKAFVSPLFAWSNAVLKGGEMMLDSMQHAARNVRVAVLPDLDLQPRRKSKSGAKAKPARRRRR